MRIESTRRFDNAGSAKARPGASSSGFSVDLAGSAAETRQAATASRLAGLDSLLSLQMVEDPLTRKKRGVKRGRSMLDALDSIKVSLLEGRIPLAELNQLVSTVQGRERDSDDPALENLLDEIELRARVELAKLDKLR